MSHSHDPLPTVGNKRKFTRCKCGQVLRLNAAGKWQASNTEASTAKAGPVSDYTTLRNKAGRKASVEDRTCGNCGKVFKNAESIVKYHGWCTAKRASVETTAEATTPKRAKRTTTETTATVEPTTPKVKSRPSTATLPPIARVASSTVTATVTVAK